MSLRLAIAPGAWGIEDPLNPDNPEWGRVLDDIGKSGFGGMELGPYGYMPTEAAVLRCELDARSLQVVAGTIYDDLVSIENRDALLRKTHDICRLIAAVNNRNEKRFLVLIDAVKDLRNNTAGHSDLAVRLELDKWKNMMVNISDISKIAMNEYGVNPVVHPHAGGFIEFRDETERFLNDISPEVTGLCLDTGHIYYAGEDPAESLLDFSGRLEYVHFKDINPSVYKKALEQRLGFFDACNQGVMCSIGRGCVDYEAIFKVLEKLNYSEWITIEQERDPKNYEGALDDVKLSYDFLDNTAKKSSINSIN
ncbi:MAG: TIM barrel protein [Spirochaetales bacterium]|uniref:TIM barrel protein n=1 Tax=Candidatus Thalassospirochaeta sargassi TaxID=3119039 RepID=A0AAJ1IFX7_9SPIO|nr:TIM barrel protein [Spirochaetales bacterium]